MVLNVEIVSKEVIKPSSPRADHLRKHNLSWLDQIAPQIHVPAIFFYTADQLRTHKFNRNQVVQYLKASLSDTLTLFYPFAGKIIENQYVECKDDGVELTEALVHTHLSRVIDHTQNRQVLKDFLPFDPCGSISKTRNLAVQVNYLDCGGIVVAISVSHKIADGISATMFFTSWATKCRGVSNIIKKPNFDLALHFPTRKSLSGFEVSSRVTKEKILTKRLLFNENVVTSLKKAISESEGKVPTRVEAVSVFLWMILKKIANSKNKRSAIVHAVNLRSRMSSSDFETDFIGNFYENAFAIAGYEECHSQDLLRLLRKSIKDMDNDFVKKLANTEDFLSSRKSKCEALFKEEAEICCFSSWCRFQFYEIDFGWGSPVWVGTTTLPYKNIVTLMSTSSGDGIEAWINLTASDMATLECDESLLSFFPADINSSG